MSRPKAVNFKTFPLYDKYHTEKVKMYSGVEITALYKIKETKNFYLSLETWAHCVSKFKRKKPFVLSINIPVIEDSKTVDFFK